MKKLLIITVLLIAAGLMAPKLIAAAPADRSSKIITAPRHGLGVNYVFMDGHVKFHTSAEYLNEVRFTGDFVEPSGSDNYRVNY